ncbi:ADP-ribosyltransferase, partial [Bacillus cereus]
KKTRDFGEDTHSADEWYKTQYENYINKLEPEQKKAIQLYTTGNYKTINQGLREGNLPTDKEDTVRNISEALSKMPISEAVVVYRKAGKNALDLEIRTNLNDINIIKNIKEKLENSIRQEKAFLSTSIANHFSDSFDARTVLFKIIVPKGTHAAYISGDLMTYQGESELLIDKGYSYKIIHVSTYEYTKTTGTKQTNLLVEIELIPK